MFRELFEKAWETDQRIDREEAMKKLEDTQKKMKRKTEIREYTGPHGYKMLALYDIDINAPKKGKLVQQYRIK